MAVQAACDQKSLLETVREYTRNTPAALEILRSSPCRSTTWGPGMIPRHGTGSFGSSLSKESRGHCSVPQVSGSLGPWVTAVYLRSQGHWSLQCSSGLRVTGSRGHCSVPQVSGSLGHCSVPVSRSQKVTRFHVWRRPQKTRSATFSVKLAHGGPKAVCCVPRKSKTYKTGYCFWLKILLDTALGHEVRGRPASQRLEVQ